MRHFQDVLDSSGDSLSHPSTSVENDNDAVSDARNNPDGLNQPSVQSFNVSGKSSWLRGIDPRIKLSWILLFLLSPILANSIWRISIVCALLLITVLSLLPPRIWWRSLIFLLVFSLIFGFLSIVLPAFFTARPARSDP